MSRPLCLLPGAVQQLFTLAQLFHWSNSAPVVSSGVLSFTLISPDYFLWCLMKTIKSFRQTDTQRTELSQKPPHADRHRGLPHYRVWFFSFICIWTISGHMALPIARSYLQRREWRSVGIGSVLPKYRAGGGTIHRAVRHPPLPRIHPVGRAAGLRHMVCGRAD